MIRSTAGHGHGAKVSKHLVRPIKTKTETLLEAPFCSRAMLVLFRPRISGRRGQQHARRSLWFPYGILSTVSPGVYCVPGLCMHHADTCM